jgi:hypothetical protein
MATNIQIKNPNTVHVLRIRNEDALKEDVKDADGKKIGEKRTGKWRVVPTAVLVKPGETADAWVGGDRRITIEELPT